MTYYLEGPSWPTNTITWDFATSILPVDAEEPFSDFDTDPVAQAAVRSAFEAWSRVANLQFVYAPFDSGLVDIRLGWGEFADPDAIGTYAINQVQAPNGEYGVDDFLSDSRGYLRDPAQTPLLLVNGVLTYIGFNTPLYQAETRQIGHLIGLADSDDPNSIMNETLGPQNLVPDANDIAGAQSLYGPAASGEIDIGSNQETVAGSLSGPPLTVTGGSGALDYAGNDGLVLLAGGSAQIEDGTVTVFAGSGSLAATGNILGEFILANGNASITGGGAGTRDIVFGGSANFTYGGLQEAASVIGGAGSATITGGAGGGYYSGGTDGNNLLTATGTGSALVGGGNNDTLRAAPTGYDYLVAGAGNETLTGAGGGTNDFYLGAGNDQVNLGPGSSQLVTGTGTAVIYGGNGSSVLYGGPGGSDLYVEQPGSMMAITGFRLGVDHIQGGMPVSIAIAGNATTLVFGDGAAVTLNGVIDPSGHGLLS